MITPEKYELLQTRLDVLCEHFEKWVDINNQEGRSDSPARHFHMRTINRLRKIGLASVFDDALFFDYLYATLVTWGMDRGKPENRLYGFRDFVDGICSHHEKIGKLGCYSLSKLDLDKDSAVLGGVWDIIASMKLSDRAPKLVLGSKTLHHLLPDLVPPIDNRYTLNFFLVKGKNKESQFKFAFIHHKFIYQRICEEKHNLIDRLINANPLNSSVTKTIDNAIQGYLKAKKSR